MAKSIIGLGVALSIVVCGGCESALTATNSVGDAMFGTNAVFSGSGNSRDEAQANMFNNARAARFFVNVDAQHHIICNESFGSWRCEGNLRGVW